MNNSKAKNTDTPDEDIDELLRLQDEFISGGQKPSASCIRPKKSNSKSAEIVSQTTAKKKSVTFAEVDESEKVSEEHNDDVNDEIPQPQFAEPMVGTIIERFSGFFELPERVVIPTNSANKIADSRFDADDAADLPDVPDLSEYWDLPAPESSSSTAEDNSLGESSASKSEHGTSCFEEASTSGKSLFAAVFDEIYAKREEKKRVSKFKVSRQKVDPELCAKEEAGAKAPEKLSPEAIAKEHANAKQRKEEEAICNLEVIRGYGLDEDGDGDSYERLAMDAVNLNFASKVMKDMVPRQEANILRLFDSLKFPFASKNLNVERKELCDRARSSLEEIKALFLEEILVEEDCRVWRFAGDVNPVVNGAWNFVPIRRVFDAVQHRAEVTDDDVEIVTLTVLWSVLLLVERPSLFHVLSMPNEVFVRIAEIFLIGPAVFENEIVSRCISILIDDYLFEKGRQNLLTFRLTASIASLDAFLPFFEDLLKHFDEYSTGDTNFALLILIAVYMNAAVGDALMLAQAIWMPGRQIVRRMTVQIRKSAPILEKLREWRVSRMVEVETEFYEPYSRLLAMYAAAIRDESVTRDRNPTAFEIAASELGEFVKRHTTANTANKELSEERVKEFDVLVDLVRETTAGKLKF